MKIDGRMCQGPYDVGYRACPCFWGNQPGSLVRSLHDAGLAPDASVRRWRVLDLGCGEGKNAIHFARKGAHVLAIDVSELAIGNARRYWPDSHLVEWRLGDVTTQIFAVAGYELVIAYGLLHCLASKEEVLATISKIQASTKSPGLNLVCTLNDRYQELSAHEGFSPCLLPHSWYVEQYRTWNIILQSDSDVSESHPHNNLPHVHSLTRIIALKT